MPLVTLEPALASVAVGRALTPAEAVAALRRGAQVEQFVRLDAGQVEYLTAHGGDQRYTLRRHVVQDQGTEDFRDISEFSPVDEEECVGEGVEVGTFEEPNSAVESALQHGGSADRWVNFGMAADAHWAARQTRGSVPFRRSSRS